MVVVVVCVYVCLSVGDGEDHLSQGGSILAVYATVIGSNLGACLTPIGALAGIMWSSILKDHNLKFGYLDFLKIGVMITIPALVSALLTLQLFS